LSILEKLAQLVRDGDLVEYRPTTAPIASVVPRRILLKKDICPSVVPVGEHPDPRVSLDAVDALQAVLNQFIHRVDAMLLGLDMKRLDPQSERVWEFRSYLRDPQLRLLGCFALENIFLGTAFRVRPDLEEKRGPLWTRAIKEAGRGFDHLVVDYPASSSGFRELVR